MKSKKSELFEQIIERHKTEIYSVCYMYAAEPQEADDLFQEVLIHLWQGCESMVEARLQRSWVYRVCLNTCISYKRKKRVKTVPLEVTSNLFNATGREGKQTAELHRRIMQLEKFDRAIVLLWLEDMSYEEIGSIVGLKAKAVGVRLVRIKEKLKTIK